MPTTTQNKERLDQIAPLILKRLGKIYNIRDAGLEYHFKFVDLENPDAVSPTIRLLVKMVVAPGDEEKERKRIQEDELVRKLFECRFCSRAVILLELPRFRLQW